MFKFNFSENENSRKSDEEVADVKWMKAQELIPDITFSKTYLNTLDPKYIQNLNCSNLTIKYIAADVTTVLADQKFDIDNFLLDAVNSHSDLLTAKYEGGLKVWEGTQDLVNYLLTNVNYNFANKNVLDLGCGAGILGILALKNGGVVNFQDYNADVLKFCTIPNILLNEVSEEKILSKCKFYSGDWGSFSELIGPTRTYDVILTSETIYNPANFSKLYSIFKENLKISGEIYLAAKSYYFGVGGGIKIFQEMLHHEHIFSSTVVWKFTEGVNREILKITRNK